MSSNGTVNGTDTSNGNGNNQDTGDIVNWVALVVSLVALIGTVAQVLQQYYSSAQGYSNCGEPVMGSWYKTTRRIFRPTELRFEVQFEAPVIFVCPPSNKLGPVKGQPIKIVDGTVESMIETRVPPPGEGKQKQPARETRVHTADNERATWVTLLFQLQAMERDSRAWVEEHYKRPKPAQPSPPPDLEVDKSSSAITLKDHTLAVAVQAKKRSWDTMPTDVKKPYAATTICHLLEIAAMMGIYWKEFDRSKDRYRAEGNGYILTGTLITDLGLMFAFQISGASRFQENRVIPVDEVKELCCGHVSTLFRADNDTRRLGILNEDPKDLGVLQLGTMNEIAETMVLLGCNTNTANYFRNEDSKHTHLFPVPFELLAMVGKTLHIKDSPFRMLPNPTPYRWDKNFFDLRKLVQEYNTRIKGIDGNGCDELKKLAQNLVDALIEDKHLETVEREKRRKLVEEKKEAEKLKREKEEQESIQRKATIKSLKVMEAQQPRAEWRKFLTPGRKRQGRDEENQVPNSDEKRSSWYSNITSNLNLPWPGSKETGPQGNVASKPAAKKSKPGYSVELLSTLHDALVECDEKLTEMANSSEGHRFVGTVLREHFQEVLKMINGDDDDDEPEDKNAKTEQANAKTRKPRHFEELSAASPEERQKKFMDIYFKDVLHEVKKRTAQSLEKSQTFYELAETPTTPVATRPRLTPTLPSDIVEGGGAQKEIYGSEAEATYIWCTLIFRMLCWLLLHDFDKNDVQYPKSELLGSRLPVYIS
ncbi:hypothetical protein B0H67DRAFT_556048 [Lasiosphaeris hirsuta]|uniref:Modin n=1 Tax=Lasiosphaeris hirsuta TaxID=260670 RepID=A0AA40A1G5_9PEZI|nr:hypothetical protein B0H67DRAFT_556048 [Lasiosphaeris hirsuta]